MADTLSDKGTAKPSAKRAGRPPKARGASNSSDDASARWTIRGVPANVRSMASKAASNRGMTVGDWLSEAIVAYSRNPSVSDNGGVSADSGVNLPSVEFAQELPKVLEDIQSRLKAIEDSSKKGLFGGIFGRHK